MFLFLAPIACGGTPPPSQPELRRLTEETLSTFRADFDAHPDEYRVLALLSPT